MKLHNFYKDMEEVGLKTDNVRRKELIEEYNGKLSSSNRAGSDSRLGGKR
jgi:hypothetical protein